MTAYFDRPVVACGNGRTAIELALRVVGVGAGDQVVVPTFCCTSIVPPILALGAAPVFADIGADLSVTPETVDAAITARTRAVIVPHLFGNPAPIDAIAAACAARDIAVIDDAAQALGATLNGRPLGSWGAAGLVSFGNGKVCFGTGGGILILPDGPTQRRAADVCLVTESPKDVLERALGVLLWRRWRRWSQPIQTVLASRQRSSAPPRPYRATGIANLDAAVALTLVNTLDANLAARRERVRWYTERLGDLDTLRLVSHRDGSACLTQVVAVRRGDTQAGALITRLRAAGYEVNSSYAPLHRQAAYAAFAPTALPVAERVAPTLFELPCEPSVRAADVERIVRTLCTRG